MVDVFVFVFVFAGSLILIPLIYFLILIVEGLAHWRWRDLLHWFGEIYLGIDP